MGYSNNDLTYDDVYSAVQSMLDSGTSLDKFSLRQIREELGGRGSLTTISKFFQPIKARLERGEALEAVELSETDMEALRTLVRDIVDRRTIFERKEKEDSAQASSDVIRALEADLAMKEEVIDDLEHQVLALQEERGAEALAKDNLNKQVVYLEVTVGALQAVIAAIGPSRDHEVPVREKPPTITVDRHEGSQTEIPIKAGDAADQAEEVCGDRG